MLENATENQARHYATVARAIGYIRDNAARQPSLADIAEAVSLSEFHLQRTFAEWAGVSPKRFLQYLTKEHAKKALRESADVLGASMTVGLSGPGRLHDLMVSCEAMTPGEIRLLGAGLRIRHGLAATPFGDALLGWTERGICHFAFCDGAAEVQLATLQMTWPQAEFVRDDTHAARLIARIFPQIPQAGRLRLVLRGTNFQIKVWEAMLKIAPSRIVSYGQLASLVGSPKAQRAVGSAVAANSIAYLIPCHRVIRETGDTGNYRWDSRRKAALLAWEASRNQ